MDLLNPPTNYVGTALFISYIATALILSTRIIIYLHNRHYLLLRLSSPQSSSRSSLAYRRRRRLTALTFLAAASFASISYHMLSFLRLSYSAFCAARRLDPFPISSLKMMAAQLWSWMLSSTLFTDFARDLATATGASRAWVRTALLWSLGVSLVVGIEGRRGRGSGGKLGELVVLAQVLPVGFAGTLFLIGVEIQGQERLMEESRLASSPYKREGDGMKKLKWRDGSPVSFVVPFAVAAYLVALPLLGGLAKSGNDGMLIISALFMRACLYVPYLATTPSDGSVTGGPMGLSPHHTAYGLFIAGAVAQLMVAWAPVVTASNEWHELLSDVQKNPAAGALGIDSVLGYFSMLVWSLP